MVELHFLHLFLELVWPQTVLRRTDSDDGQKIYNISPVTRKYNVGKLSFPFFQHLQVFNQSNEIIDKTENRVVFTEASVKYYKKRVERTY
jgi:hypothetical protein